MKDRQSLRGGAAGKIPQQGLSPSISDTSTFDVAETRPGPSRSNRRTSGSQSRQSKRSIKQLMSHYIIASTWFVWYMRDWGQWASWFVWSGCPTRGRTDCRSRHYWGNLRCPTEQGTPRCITPIYVHIFESRDHVCHSLKAVGVGIEVISLYL